MSNPYKALFEAVRTRLVDASGPFVNANVVRLWADEALDTLQPSDTLISMLCQATPQAIVTYAGGSKGESPGGAGEFTTRKRFRVLFGARGPGDDFDKAHYGEGPGGVGSSAAYWGIFEMLYWIERRLSNHQLTGGVWDRVEYENDDTIPTGGKGKLAHAFTFSAQFLITTGD